MKAGKFVHVAPREIEGGYYLKDIYRLRDNTEIGETIKFRIEKTYGFVGGGEVEVPGIIKGKVAAKYPHTFMLEDGSTYTWVDYMLGRQI